MELLDIDEMQAQAILDMQLRRLAALERQKIIDDHDELEAEILDFRTSWPSPGGSATSSPTELAEIVDKFGDDRRTQILPSTGDMSMEDLIPEEDVVVTITRGGYAKRTKGRRSTGRSARRQGRARGVAARRGRGRALLHDDLHHWLLFFTNLGRVYRAKAYELPEAGRDAKGQHVANLMAFQPGEKIAQVLAITRLPAGALPRAGDQERAGQEDPAGRVRLPRSGGLIAVNLRDGDELVGAGLARPSDDLLLVSRKGQSVRFHADDATLRPMGRATSA
jgi:DNA gyrase subunit A